MKLIIDIPERIYKINQNRTLNITDSRILEVAVRDGTPLPKGHGRLIDADKLQVELECGIRAENYEEGYEKYAHINDMDDCVDAVVYADTIIEADGGDEE